MTDRYDLWSLDKGEILIRWPWKKDEIWCLSQKEIDEVEEWFDLVRRRFTREATAALERNDDNPIDQMT